MADCILNVPSKSSASSSGENCLIINELPGGLINCLNLSFTTANEFIANSLEVWLDGVKLDPTQYTEGIDLQSFVLLLEPTNSNGLKSPPRDTERLRVNYVASGSPAGGITTGCIVCV